MRTKCFCISALLLSLAAGCAGDKPAPQTVAPRDTGTIVFKPYVPSTQPVAPDSGALPVNPHDAHPPLPLVYSVDVYDFVLPVDAVSRNEEFWKKVNESSVDVGTYDILYKNGFRVGEIPIAEWEAFGKLVDERKGKKTVVSGIAQRQIELPMRERVPQQTIFYFDRRGEVAGRSFELSRNVMYFSFETTPRRPGEVRLSMTPAVIGQIKKPRFSITPGKPDGEIIMTAEERFYDINLRADLPLTHFLIIATSPEARYDNCLGRLFMTVDDPSQIMEHVIAVCPRAYQQVEQAEPTPQK